jgi:hypothetical protein
MTDVLQCADLHLSLEVVTARTMRAVIARGSQTLAVKDYNLSGFRRSDVVINICEAVEAVNPSAEPVGVSADWQADYSGTYTLAKRVARAVMAFRAV